MDIKDTVGLMLSDDYKKRFQAEYMQLTVRIQKLEVFIKDYLAGKLSFEPTCSYEMLYEQLIDMYHYQGALQKRAKLEHINLDTIEVSSFDDSVKLLPLQKDDDGWPYNDYCFTDWLMEIQRYLVGLTEVHYTTDSFTKDEAKIIAKICVWGTTLLNTMGYDEIKRNKLFERVNKQNQQSAKVVDTND